MDANNYNLLDNKLHVIENNRQRLTEWFALKRSELKMPIYGSVDVRDSGFKIAVVDANHFPAGFNNVPQSERGTLAKLMKTHIERDHPGSKHVHLYPEMHTRNQAYVENLRTLKEILNLAGYDVTVGSPELSEFGSLAGITGPLCLTRTGIDYDGKLQVEGKGRPDMVLLNNDLTKGVLPGLDVKSVSPPVEMGWHRRRKSEHFAALDIYVAEVSEMLQLDPWMLKPLWFVSEEKCLERNTCMVELAAEIDHFIAQIQAKYDEYGVADEPVVYVKNDRGTYGLGILVISEGKQLLNLSKRKLHKLTYGKGGALAEDFLIQEGVPTALELNGSPVEPVVYLVDGEAASWFYRYNPKRDRIGNLNSPSAQFISREDMLKEENGQSIIRHAENWHALAAELSMLAMGLELQNQQVDE